MIAGAALASLGIAIWLLVLALARSPGGTVMLVFSLVADAAAFAFLALALHRAQARSSPGSSPRP
jgi:hypothetical protein